MYSWFTDFKEALSLCFIVGCLTVLCVKGCAIVNDKSERVTIAAMKNGYVQSSVQGSTEIIWVKPKGE